MRKAVSFVVVALVMWSLPLQGKELSKDEESLKAHMKSLFEVSKDVNAKDKGKRAKARKAIQGALDWDAIAKACLGPKNLKKNAKGYPKFRNLLRDVIVQTSFGRLGKFWDKTEYTFDVVKVEGNTGHVKATFEIPDDEVILEYFISRQKGKWYIDDIAFENLRYSENIREQIDAFLSEKSFNELLNRLRKRHKELQEDEERPPGKKSASKKKGL